MVAKENRYVAVFVGIITSNITTRKHCNMKMQQHHPRTCKNEKKEKTQECEEQKKKRKHNSVKLSLPMGPAPRLGC